MTGTLIAMEGIDGAGTTTQARLLGDWLEAQEMQAHVTCEPSDGPAGKLLRRILRHEVQQMDAAAIALLFAADRLHHVRAEIEPHRQQGRHVISDRYVYSSLAYQSVDLERAWVASINRQAFEPELTIYLRVTPSLAAERRSSRGGSAELFETARLQERIFAIYEDLFGSNTADGSWSMDPGGSAWIQKGPNGSRASHEAIGRRPCWAVIDGSLSVERIHELIRQLVETMIKTRSED